jgi:hypothetical protein
MITGARIATFELLRCLFGTLLLLTTSASFLLGSVGGGGGGGLLGGAGGACLGGGGGGGGRAFGGGGLAPAGGPGGGGGRTIVCAIAIVFLWSPGGASAVGKEVTSVICSATNAIPVNFSFVHFTSLYPAVALR